MWNNSMDCPAVKNGKKKVTEIGLGRAKSTALGQETARHGGKETPGEIRDFFSLDSYEN